MPLTTIFSLPYPADADPAGLGAAAMGDLAAAVEAVLDGMPRGPIDRKTKSSQQTGITTTADITGLSITFTAGAGRKYRVHAECHLFSNAGGDLAQMIIADGAGTALQLAQVSCIANFGVKAVAEIDVEPGAGSVTYKVRAVRGVGTGSVTFDCGPTYPAIIRIEDIGPA